MLRSFPMAAALCILATLGLFLSEPNRFCQLGDRGIVGNGHMMMLENNSDTLAEHIVSWIESG
jgi:hypothetical protein